jgi:EpsI family protein
MVKGAEDQTGSSGSPIQAELPNLSEPANPQNYLNPPNPPNSPNLLPAPKGLKAFFHPPQFVVAVLLLAGTLALAQGVEFREKIPPAKDFASFPLELGDWTGRREIMEEKFLKELDLNDYVIVDYMNGSKAVNFYTAYYESQRKGESIHSPETCLPGGGWEFRNAGAVTLPLKARNGEPMRVNRAFMEKGATKQLSYFWFPSRDRVLTNAWEMKWYNFWDALTRQRTDGALVRLITPVYAGEEAADADKRLVAFTKEIVPVLNEFLPK